MPRIYPARATNIPVTPALLALLLAFTLAACGGKARTSPTPTVDESTLYKPPTLAVPMTPVVYVTPTPKLSEASLKATATHDCTDVLSFIEDITVPDGTQVAPGEKIDKRWKVENTGTCNWDDRYKVRLIEGPELGAAKEQALYPARAGTQAEVAIQFTAPTEPGTYRSAWQAVTPNGDPFGDMFYIEVVVK